MKHWLLLVLLLMPGAPPAWAGALLIEAESFAHTGGWTIDFIQGTNERGGSCCV